MLKAISLAVALLLLLPIYTQSVQSSASDYPAATPRQQCEPIRVNLCRGLGYNETSMPNFVGHELQSDVESTLQTFRPLIEYACSTQLKLFLCAAYVPMCTPTVHHVPIGPCRSLCESVRSRCHPVLQGFGYPWPPALECSRFPKENNQVQMCMEGEVHATLPESEPTGHAVITAKQLQCPGIKSRLYVKLHRSGRCAPYCDANILFDQHEKHVAEVWVATWTYASLGLALAATLCLIFSDDGRNGAAKWIDTLTPLIWCNVMVTVGWTVRFLVGRTAASCGYDPQVPNVSLLLLDGLSNAFCATTFLLRYYFGMAACVWWAILCLDWHRGVRRKSVDVMLPAPATTTVYGRQKRSPHGSAAREKNITQSNFARFAGWSLPAFQTAAVIVTRLVDSDELLGACFVGNQSDKGLQILVLAPLFCYWIFGSVNLISGYLVHRRNKELRKSLGSANQLRVKDPHGNVGGTGTFLFVYCVPCAVLLLCIIYEFANIDVWLNVPAYVTAIEGLTTPLWPFLSRAFMELMLGIICFAWLLGPKIAMLYKRQFTAQQPAKPVAAVAHATPSQRSTTGSRATNGAYSMVSYQTVRMPVATHAHNMPKHARIASGMSMHQMSNYHPSGRGKSKSSAAAAAKLHLYNKSPETIF